MGEPLRRQGEQVGMDHAERWVALSDGGAGLEDWLRANFPRVEAVILDFYHAAEYLGEWAKVLHADAAEAKGVAAACRGFSTRPPSPAAGHSRRTSGAGRTG